MDDLLTTKVELELRITKQDIEDIIVTALEGGIGYWACLDNTQEEWAYFKNTDIVSEYAANTILLNDQSLFFIDVEDDSEIWELTLEKLINGIKMVLFNGDENLIKKSDKDNIFELDLDCMDANVADNIIQYALFNELVFA